MDRAEFASANFDSSILVDDLFLGFFVLLGVWDVQRASARVCLRDDFDIVVREVLHHRASALVKLIQIAVLNRYDA